MALHDEDLAEMTVQQRLELIDILWGSLSNEKDLPLSTAHAEELDKRLEYERQNPTDVVGWEEVKARFFKDVK